MSKVAKQARGAMSRSLVLIGNEAKNHFVKSFRDRGFTDKTLVKWKPRKKGTKRRPNRAEVMDDSGDLWRSIHRKTLSRTGLFVTLATNRPYAKIHNDGLMGKAFGKHSFKMTKRQYIGDSRVLNKKNEKIIVKTLNPIFFK